MARHRSGLAALICAAFAAAFVSIAICPQPVLAQGMVHHGNQPAPPVRIGQGLYYVGASDIASYLLVTRAGMILIDGGYDDTAPQILANIRRLGFDPRQIRILLNTHAHLDHAGGLAAIKAATGATLYAAPLDAALIDHGGRNDFSFGNRLTFPPAHVDRLLSDGQRVSLGGVTLTAHITPGHTRGCTSWTFPVTVAGQVRQALVICSLTVLPNYRLTGPNPSYPGIAADYARSFRTLRALRCDVFLGSHGGFFNLTAKRAAVAAGHADAFVDPVGCRAFLERSEAAYRTRLSP